MNNSLVIIVPVLNEEQTLYKQIEYLNALKKISNVLFVDGGSKDKTISILTKNNHKVISSPKLGRGAQLSYGVHNSPDYCKYVLFLHIDTRLPNNFMTTVVRCLNKSHWGHFRIKLDSNKVIYRVIEFMMNTRSRITSIATGDQTLFFRKNVFLQCSENIEQHPIMEDIYISKYLKMNFGRASIINDQVHTSTRYWDNNGVLKTIFKMWKFRLCYLVGMKPAKIYELYYR